MPTNIVFGLSGHSGGDPFRPSAADLSVAAGRCSGHSPGWFWTPGGLAVNRPAPILQGAALPQASGTDPKALPAVMHVGFPDGAWDPLLRAATIAAGLSEYLEWQKMHDQLRAALEVASTEIEMKKELEILWDKKAGRFGRADAIRAQSADFTTYFADIMAASPASRPNTWALILIGLQLAGLVTSRFKLTFKRARPAQVWPAIEPMIDTPAHPSFPSGHAMQAWLIANLMAALVPPTTTVCNAIAENIAENREYAGVHWPSDGEASKALVSGLVMPRLEALLDDNIVRAKVNSELREFRRIFVRAREEWIIDGSYPSSFHAPSVGPEKGPLDRLVDVAIAVKKALDAPVTEE